MEDIQPELFVVWDIDKSIEQYELVWSFFEWWSQRVFREILYEFVFVVGFLDFGLRVGVGNRHAGESSEHGSVV